MRLKGIGAVVVALLVLPGSAAVAAGSQQGEWQATCTPLPVSEGAIELHVGSQTVHVPGLSAISACVEWASTVQGTPTVSPHRDCGLACFSARLSGVTVSEDFRVELRFTQDSEVKIIQIDPDPVGLDRPLDEICVSYHDPAAPDPCLVSIGSPSDLQAKGRVGRVALAWTESSETYGRTVELTYEIYRSVTGEADSFSLIGTTSEPKFVDRGLGSGQQLWYFVAAVDAQGNRSAGSDTATARTR